MLDLSQIFLPIKNVLGDIWIFDFGAPNFRVERALNVFLFILFIWNSISFSPLISMFMLQLCNLQLLWILFKWPKKPKSVGASDKEISKLNGWKYKEDGNKKDSNLIPTYEKECCICLAKYVENDEIRELPCSHMFHQTCVDKWLKIRSICPICSKDLEGKKKD